jgi:hypothetical protein
MPTKRDANNTNQVSKRNTGSKKNKGKTRCAKRKHSPALVPVSNLLADFITLVNLLPVQFRHPRWARRNEVGYRESKYVLYEDHILEWRPGAESREAKAARLLGREIPEECRINTPDLLWFKLDSVLEELPLLLQAFVLHDEGINITKIGKRLGVVPSHADPDLQALYNFELLKVSESALKKIVQRAWERISGAFEEEGKRLTLVQKSLHPRKTAMYLRPVFAEALGLRARQRLIFVLAAQEFLSCLAHPEHPRVLLSRRISRLSDATQARPYIIQEGPDKGKLALLPPILYQRLEGIEATRIRECPICYKIFWAGRKDMRCCSTQCASVLRARNYRRAYKEKYAYQRYQKAEIEGCKPTTR